MLSGCKHAYRDRRMGCHCEKFGYPSTYREIFELLHKHKIIDEEAFENMKRLIFLRNLIAHEYYKITESELIEMVKLIEHVKNFIEKVKMMQK